MVRSQFHQGLYLMTLQPEAPYVLPVEIAKVAHAIWPSAIASGNASELFK